MTEFIKNLRDYIGDSQPPYLVSNDELKTYIETALNEYSRYSPIKRKTVITTNLLPEDYITWISGLEEYCVLGNKVLGKNEDIELLYYAKRSISEIPDISLIMEYCFSEFIINSITKDIKNVDEVVKSMKLGQGLEITFEDSENRINKLYSIAESKKKHFYDVVKNKNYGGWY